VRICGAPSTRYFIFNHTRYLKHVRYSHRPGPVGPIWRYTCTVTDPDPSDRYGYARTARARACGTATFHNTQQRTEYTQTGRHRYRRVDVLRYTRTLVHASRSTYTRFRDQYPFHTYSRTRTPPRGDPTLTRDRGRSGTIQLTGACLSTMLSTQFRCSATPPRAREGTDAASIACYDCTRSNQGDRRSVVSRLSRDGVEVVRHTSLRVKVGRPLLVRMALLISA